MSWLSAQGKQQVQTDAPASGVQADMGTVYIILATRMVEEVGGQPLSHHRSEEHW